MASTIEFARTVGAAGIALAVLAGPALADGSIKDSPAGGREFSWSVNFGGTSDYIFRGVSQSDEDPEFQAGIDASYGILYAGIWGSGVDPDFVGGSNAEIDFYGGIKPVLGPLTFDFGVIYYWYPGSDDPGPEADYVEVKAGVSATPITDLAVGFNTYYTGEGTLGSGEIWTFEGNAGYTLPTIGIFSPSVSGVLGYVDFQDDDTLSYTYWNAGLSLTVEKLTFDFRYWDTDIDTIDGHGHNLSDERFVFSAKVVLP